MNIVNLSMIKSMLSEVYQEKAFEGQYQIKMVVEFKISNKTVQNEVPDEFNQYSSQNMHQVKISLQPLICQLNFLHGKVTV